MITAQMVKELRERTGAGMMDCKKALNECSGDTEKAVELLREKGLAAAAKKAGRIASEGLVKTYLSDDKKTASIVEVNCETDFVSLNEDFVALVDNVAKQAAATGSDNIDSFVEEKR
jgi:elongation factor Ts